MKPRVFLHRRRRFNGLASLIALFVLSGAANAQDCLSIPDQYPGFPIYTRGLATRAVPYGLDDWCAAVCYRSPDCIPSNFDLIDYVDFDLLDPSRAAEFPFLMEGFAIWEDGKNPNVGDQPYYWELYDVEDVAVPIWFFTWEDKLRALKNGKLKIHELEKIPSLRKGHADFYFETGDLGAGPEEYLVLIVASGQLEDGTPFSMLYEAYGDLRDYLTVTFSE